MRSWALAPMLLLPAAACDGETFFLGEQRHETDADDDDSELTADAGLFPELDAAGEEGDAAPDADADAGLPDARSDARPRFEAGMGDADAADGEAEPDNNAWAYCDWTTDCPRSRPYCNPVFLDQSSVAWVCLECDLYTPGTCQTDETCLLRWNLIRPQAACVPIDAGRPPPRGNGSGT